MRYNLLAFLSVFFGANCDKIVLVYTFFMCSFKMTISSLPTIPPKPVEPYDYECCQSECGDSCVYTIYQSQKTAYNRQIKALLDSGQISQDDYNALI